MDIQEAAQLRTFFGLDGARETCRLFLPAFHGPVTAGDGVDLRYSGDTFAARDARAASYVASVLGRVVESPDILMQEVGEFAPGGAGPAFLFGSRSNRASGWAAGGAALGRFIRFEYGPEWVIRGAGGQRFAMPAPSELSREAYERQTDYGVIGRFRTPGADDSTFLIAGLGSRATEGCGYYLARSWKQLAGKFEGRDFALVLRFPPPIDPRRSEVLVAFDDVHPDGFEPGS